MFGKTDRDDASQKAWKEHSELPQEAPSLASLKMPPLIHAFWAPSNNEMESVVRFFSRTPKRDFEVKFKDPEKNNIKRVLFETVTVACGYGLVYTTGLASCAAALSLHLLFSSQSSFGAALISAGISILSALGTLKLWDYGNRRASNQLQLKPRAQREESES